MLNPRALGLLVVVALLAGTVCYLAVGGGTDRAPGPGTTSATARESGGAPVQPEQGQSAPEAQAPDAAARETLAPAAPSGAMLIGRVVDENGAPIAGALVACTASLSPDPRELDAAAFDDPARLLERARERLSQRREATTGPDGAFRVAAVAGGRTVAVSARARAFQVTTKQAARPTDADVDLGAVVLRRGAVVSGRVVDRANAPVAGAQVSRRNKDEPRGIDGVNLQGSLWGPGGELFELMRGGQGEAITDADGRFELANAQPGEFALRARHAEHPTLRREGLTVAPGVELADVILVLEPGAGVAGRLLDVPAGAKELRVLAAPPADPAAPTPPGSGVNAMFGQIAGQFGAFASDSGLTAERSAAVAADGSFALAGLAVGRRYRVFATQGGSQALQPASVCSQRVEVQSGAQGVELHYDAGVQVTAHVVDERTGAPVETLWVRDQLEGGGMADVMGMMNMRGTRPRACPGGVLVLAGLRPQEKQTLHLVIDAIGYHGSDQKGIALPPAGAVDLGVVRLQSVPVVRIQVVAKDGGAPVADATVRLRADRGANANWGDGGGNGFAFGPGGFGPGGGIGTARTDAHGRCTLNALGEGAFVVLVSNKDFAPYASDPLQSKPDGDLEHRAELLHGGAVEVRVVDADGKPVADARVDHAAPGGDNDTRPTDGAGSVLFEQLAPGKHKFRLAGTGGGRGGGAFGNRGRRNPGDGGPAGGAGPGGGGVGGEGDWQQLDVADGQRLSLQLSRTPTASLSGTVRENGVPLANARLALLEGTGDAAASGDPTRDAVVRMSEAFGGGRNGRTDDDGRYSLKELKPGEHRLRVTHNDRSMPTVVRVSLRAGDNVQDVDLDAALLRGTVKDPQGQPVAGATVRVAAASGADDLSLDAVIPGAQLPGNGGRTEARTGGDGRFELRGVQGGVPLIVRAQAKGFAGGASAPVAVQPGSTRDGVDVQLAIGGTVRVRASSDQPFASVIATMQGDEGKGVAPAFAMLANGTAVLEGLKPGRWQVSLRTMRGLRGPRGGRGANAGPGNAGPGTAGAAGGDPDARMVDVAPGQTVDVVF